MQLQFNCLGVLYYLPEFEFGRLHRLSLTTDLALFPAVLPNIEYSGPVTPSLRPVG